MDALFTPEIKAEWIAPDVTRLDLSETELLAVSTDDGGGGLS